MVDAFKITIIYHALNKANKRRIKIIIMAYVQARSEKKSFISFGSCVRPRGKITLNHIIRAKVVKHNIVNCFLR